MSSQFTCIILLVVVICSQSSHITIGTFNLAKAGTLDSSLPEDVKYNLESTAHLIIENNIDIIALQELDVNTDRISEQIDDPQYIVDSIKNLYGRSYAARFVNVYSYKNGEYGNSVIFNLERFEDALNNKINRYIYQHKGPDVETRGFISTKFIFYDTDNIDIGLRSLWFISTHLTKHGGEDAFIQLKELMEQVKSYSYPTIICGDFNIDYNDETVQNELNNIINEYMFENIIESGQIIATHPSSGKRLDFCLFKDDRNWFDIDLNNIRYIEPRAHDGTLFSDHLGMVFTLNFQ